MATAAYTPTHAAAPAEAPAMSRARPKAIAAWLFAVAALVFAMVVVGGITRLTESGLSIVKWDPVGGIVPPLTAADWAAEYSPPTAPARRGVLVNAAMGLAAFKGIFFWEYLHRVIARHVIVAVLVVPLAWFALRRCGARAAMARGCWSSLGARRARTGRRLVDGRERARQAARGRARTAGDAPDRSR